jgi:predicted MPP superfamily phosphohydrolase
VVPRSPKFHSEVPRLATFLLFLAIALTIVGAAHYYVWVRLVRDLRLPTYAHRVLTAVLVVLYLSVPATFWLSRALPPNSGRGLLLLLYVWFGLVFYFVVLLALGDLARAVAHFGQRFQAHAPPLDPERRVTLARLVAGAVTLVAGGIGTTAVVSGLGPLEVRQLRVRLARLPRALDGLTIVQLTDLHLGPTLRRPFVEEVVRRTNALRPDVIAITGDLVDGSVAKLRHVVEPIRELRARHGVYFVTGNHEYYSGVEAWCEELSRLGVRVLRNERVSIGDGQQSFDLAGVNDHQGQSLGPGSGPDVPRALSGRDPKRELVLLAHQPKAVHEAAAHGVGLVLSGHTHGGQLWPWCYLVRLTQPVLSGLARFGDTQIYVSRGTGYWGPPMRLGIPAEITQVVLEAGSAGH